MKQNFKKKAGEAGSRGGALKREDWDLWTRSWYISQGKQAANNLK